MRRLRRLARETLNAIERLLHPLRRRRALRGLTSERPGALLVLCYGNICRSPYAAARLRQVFGGGDDASFTVESAGFILPGRESPEIARSVARRRGIDLAGHRSQVVDGAMLERADAVLVMTPGQRRQVLRDVAGADPPPVLLLGDFDENTPSRRMILDPYGHSEAVFSDVFERIDRCCRGVRRALDPISVDQAHPRRTDGPLIS